MLQTEVQKFLDGPKPTREATQEEADENVDIFLRHYQNYAILTMIYYSTKPEP